MFLTQNITVYHSVSGLRGSYKSKAARMLKGRCNTQLPQMMSVNGEKKTDNHQPRTYGVSKRNCFVNLFSRHQRSGFLWDISIRVSYFTLFLSTPPCLSPRPPFLALFLPQRAPFWAFTSRAFHSLLLPHSL